MDLRDTAARLKLQDNVPWTQMADAFYKATGHRWSYDRIRSAVRNHPDYGNSEPVDDIPGVILKQVTKGATLSELSEKLNLSQRMTQAAVDDLKEQGYIIDTVGDVLKLCRSLPAEVNRYVDTWQGQKVIRFGVVSDTHFCSNWQQKTLLNQFYDLLACEGIDTVFHPGDLTEGVGMRQGHEYEIFAHGADAQAKYVIDHYPKREGIVTKFVTGNHDHTGIKAAGHDIGYVIAQARPDMIYLGRANAKVKITPNCTVELNHPLDGATYALSYALQKTIDAMPGGDKPNILLNGHHHKAFYLFYRNIHALECGTFQAQTPWMRGKRIAAHMGGWIVDVHVDDAGTVTRFKGEFVPYYDAIEDDH